MKSHAEYLRGDLTRLRDKIEAAGFSIHAIWTSEYGGEESVKLGNMDRLEVRENETKRTKTD